MCQLQCMRFTSPMGLDLRRGQWVARRWSIEQRVGFLSHGVYQSFDCSGVCIRPRPIGEDAPEKNAKLFQTG